MMMPWEGEVDYQDDFSIVDEEDEYKKLQIARQAASGPEALAVIDQMIINLINEDIDETMPPDQSQEQPVLDISPPSLVQPAQPQSNTVAQSNTSALRPRIYIGNPQ